MERGNLEEAFNINAEVLTIDNRLVESYHKFLSNSVFSETASAFLAYKRSVDEIKNSILILAETKELYSVKALFRVLLDYYLRFL